MLPKEREGRESREHARNYFKQQKKTSKELTVE